MNRTFKGFYGLLIAGGLSLAMMVGCGGGGGGGNSSSSQLTTMQTVGSAGGSVTLSDGSSVTVDSGIVNEGTTITVSQISAPSVPLAEGETLASPVVQVEIPSTSLLSAPSPDNGMYLIIQTQTPSSSSSPKRMAAPSISDIYKTVRVTISNGTKTTVTYAKYSADEAGKAMVWVGNKYWDTINAVGEPLGSVIFKVEAAVTAVDTTLSRCFSGSQIDKLYRVVLEDSFIETSVINPNKTPLILVHGWQVGPENCLEAYKSTWSKFIQQYFQDSELPDKYQLFSFSYNTSRSIEENGQLLSQKLSQTFGDKPVVVLAHSMGGLVTRSALVKNNAKIQGLVMLATPNHGTILRRIDEILIKKGVTNLSKAAIAAEGVWFLTLGVEGARQLDWDNFDGKILSCSLLPCNSFLAGLNQADNNYNNYVAFAGKDLDVLDAPLTLALQTAEIPTSNDMIVPEVSALFRDYNSATTTYLERQLKDNKVFNDIGHFKIHDDSNVLHEVKAALLGFSVQSDTTLPTVSSISPANNATGIAVNVPITATFSKAMDSSTINAATFMLSNGSSNVAGTVTYSGTTATFTPYSNLAFSTTYTATITTGVKDSAGNAIASDYSWTFTTANGTGGVSFTW